MNTATADPTDTARVCHAASCGVLLVKREHPTPTQAEQGEWYDHPPVPAATVGHTSALLVPSEPDQ